MTRRPPISTFFPHTPLFRSGPAGCANARGERLEQSTRRSGSLRFRGPRQPPLLPRLFLLAAAGIAVGAAASAAKSDRKSTRLNSSHGYISYAVFCLKKKKKH